MLSDQLATTSASPSGVSAIERGSPTTGTWTTDPSGRVIATCVANHSADVAVVRPSGDAQNVPTGSVSESYANEGSVRPSRGTLATRCSFPVIPRSAPSVQVRFHRLDSSSVVSHSGSEPATAVRMPPRHGSSNSNADQYTRPSGSTATSWSTHVRQVATTSPDGQRMSRTRPPSFRSFEATTANHSPLDEKAPSSGRSPPMSMHRASRGGAPAAAAKSPLARARTVRALRARRPDAWPVAPRAGPSPAPARPRASLPGPRPVRPVRSGSIR